MKWIRSVFALSCALLVMGCQTAAVSASASRPVTLGDARSLSRSTEGPLASAARLGVAPQATRSAVAPAAAFAAADSRRTVLIVAAVAVAIVIGVLLFSGDSNGGY